MAELERAEGKMGEFFIGENKYRDMETDQALGLMELWLSAPTSPNAPSPFLLHSPSFRAENSSSHAIPTSNPVTAENLWLYQGKVLLV